MNLSMLEFTALTSEINKICGLDIKEEKLYLIQQRLEPLVRTFGYSSFAELGANMVKSQNTQLRDLVISAITTNETFFFRDKHYFDAFKEHILPELGDLVRERKTRVPERKGCKVRIWSAASSTGQEPYTLAILLHEYSRVNRYLGIESHDFGILASDICQKALAQAISGEYSELEINRGLDDETREKYFEQNGNAWTVHDWLQNIIEFRRVNLTDPFSALGGFDVIFCRNVLIYFDDETKRKIIDGFYQMLSPGGYLIFGSTESIYGLSDKLTTVNHGNSIFYKKQ